MMIVATERDIKPAHVTERRLINGTVRTYDSREIEELHVAVRCAEAIIEAGEAFKNEILHRATDNSATNQACAHVDAAIIWAIKDSLDL